VKNTGVGRGQVVLIVEDNPVLLALCEEVLTMAGYKSLGASNGTDARELAGKASLAIIDVGLPDVSGIKLAEELGDLPVLLMSGNPPERFLNQLEDPDNRWAFIRKPFDLEELIQSVERLMG
jgi:DNA-binding response OmpR family regulator